MKTPEQIAAEMKKLLELDQGGTLGPMGSIGTPFAMQALSWVLNEDAHPASELVTQADVAI